MMIRGIIFDHDGVIADSQKRQYHWFKYWAKENNIPFYPNSFKEFSAIYNVAIRENGVQHAYDTFNLPCDMDDHSHPVWDAYNDYKENNSIKLFDGMPEAIKEIRELTHLTSDVRMNLRPRIVVNTTNTWKTIYPLYSKNNILSYFDGFVTAEVLKDFVGMGNSKDIMKPSKVSVALSLGVLGTQDGSIIHIGDCLTDLAASHDVFMHYGGARADIKTIGVAWGFDGKKTLEKGILTPGGHKYFDHIVDSPYEIVDTIKQYTH